MDVVSGFHHVTAVAVDPGGEARGDDASLMQHRRSVFEIADPQRAGLLACPAAADFLLADAELAARGPFPAEVAIDNLVGQALNEVSALNAERQIRLCPHTTRRFKL